MDIEALHDASEILHNYDHTRQLTSLLPKFPSIFLPEDKQVISTSSFSQSIQMQKFLKNKPMETIHSEIVNLTEIYGGPWGLNHTRRLLKLIDIISKGEDYDREVVWVAAHLHDWGGYSTWAQEGIDHAIRSKQVASQILPQLGYSASFIAKVLECIETHHSGGDERSTEAKLLSDADALDFLGVVGVLRDFAKKPKDLKNACAAVKKRMSQLPDILCLKRSKTIAEMRLQEMSWLLDRFEEETFQLY